MAQEGGSLMQGGVPGDGGGFLAPWGFLAPRVPPLPRGCPLTLPAVLELMSTQVSAALSQKMPRVRGGLWASSSGTEP